MLLKIKILTLKHFFKLQFSKETLTWISANYSWVQNLLLYVNLKRVTDNIDF